MTVDGLIWLLRHCPKKMTVVIGNPERTYDPLYEAESMRQIRVAKGPRRHTYYPSKRGKTTVIVVGS